MDVRPDARALHPVSRASTFHVVSFVFRARIAPHASPYLHHPLAHRNCTLPSRLSRVGRDRLRPAPYHAFGDRLCLLRIALAPLLADVRRVTLAIPFNA